MQSPHIRQTNPTERITRITTECQKCHTLHFRSRIAFGVAILAFILGVLVPIPSPLHYSLRMLLITLGLGIPLLTGILLIS